MDKEKREKWETGYAKQSFEMFYKGGIIWFEHLDALYDRFDLLREKLYRDKKEFKKPSASSHIVVVLDETQAGEEEIKLIWDVLNEEGKQPRKLAFTGLSRKNSTLIKELSQKVSYPVRCFSDLEKAKDWIL